MRKESHSTTWTSLRRIMGSSCEIHKVSSAKNTRFSGCHLRGTVHLTCWDRGLSKLQTLVCLIWWSFQSNLSPGHFLIGEPLTQLPAADFTDVKCNRLSRWQTYQNNCISSGNVDHPTTSRVCNSVNAGRGHHLTYNQAISSCWGRTTRLHYTGPQLSPRKPIQGTMASYAWTHLGPPREFLNVPLQKFALYRVWIVNYSVIVLGGGSYVTLRAEFLQLDFLANNRRNIGVTDCTTLVNLGMMQPSRVMWRHSASRSLENSLCSSLGSSRLAIARVNLCIAIREGAGMQLLLQHFE